VTVVWWSVKLIRGAARIVPFGLRAEWQQEWEAEAFYRFDALQRENRFTALAAIALFVRCMGAVPDALWLCRHEWSADVLTQDVRYSLRRLAAAPAFTAAIVFILALGIGANTAVFSVVNSVLLRPLPFPEPDRLVMIWDVSPDLTRQKDGPSPGNMLDWRAQNTVFEGIAAWYDAQPRTYREDHDAEKVQAAQVTADFFAVFGRQPQIGRTFDASEVERQDQIVILSNAFWQRRFNGDSSVIGRRILLDETPHQVIGVMPADFAMPNKDVGVWVPWDFNRGYAHLPAGVPRDFRFLRVAARLKPDVTLQQAQENMNALSAALEQYPVNKGWRTRVRPLKDELVGDLRPVLWVLLGAVSCVLLIACTNISNLLLTKASGRSRELAVRLAIGASRPRIVRQLLTENLILSIAGGIAGLLTAYWGLYALMSLAPEGLPRLDETRIDSNVLLFTALISVMTALLFGLLPTLRATRKDLAESLRAGSSGSGTSRSHRRFGSALVIFEITAAFTLMAGAGLLLQSFLNIIRVPSGFDASNVLVMRVFPDARLYRTGEQRLTYFGTLSERLQSLPSVQSVGATTGLPMNQYNNAPMRPYWREDRPLPDGGAAQGRLSMVTPGYFETMKIRMLGGRNFDSGDHAQSQPVVILNSTLARLLWQDESPVGKNLMIDYAARGKYPYLVVGVVDDVRGRGLRIAPEPEMFLPHAQVPYATMNMVVRTSGEPTQLANVIRRIILDVDPTQPVYSITTMNDLVAGTLARERFSSTLLGVLAALALVLAAFGTYSVMSFFVSHRTREIGVRVALGARGRDVSAMVLRQGLFIAACGVVLGSLFSLGLTRPMSSMLFGVTAVEPVVFIGVPALLTMTALIASYVPARRASRVDPIDALRQE
jgi:putative ABC transport system permease protein